MLRIDWSGGRREFHRIQLRNHVLPRLPMEHITFNELEYQHATNFFF